MPGKEASPSASSAFLPLAKQLRRASVTSITSLFDKQSLNQTLDQIHSSASQSETLTTFNDYTSPPPSTAVQKKSQDEATGIGSWYTRMTGSMTSTKSSKDGQTPASRGSTGQTERTGPPEPDSNNAATTALPGPETMSESRDSLRAPSRRSQYSQANDTKSIASSASKDTKPDAAKGAHAVSHRAGLSVSSQISASQAPFAATSESKADLNQSVPSLKRALTPEPSAPASPMLYDQNHSRPSLSLATAKSPSRAPSVASSTSTHKQDKNDDPIEPSRESSQPNSAEVDTVPKLTRLQSVPHAKTDPSTDESAKIRTGPSSNSTRTSATRTASPSKASSGEAMAALKRLQTQRLGSAASVNAQTQTVGATLSQLRNRVLSRQYWMKDENARDCFDCGDPFSTFRRKHHCRTCGQIFDAKCTTLVSGSSFDQAGNIRVCKQCESLINGYDDSSDYTDDDTASVMTSRTRHRLNSKGDISPTRPSTPGMSLDAAAQGIRSNINNFKSHLPSVIGRRMIDDLKRSSGHYDDDSDRKSLRPQSSRSLKSSHGMRPHPSHRRHHSKHLLQRNPRTVVEEKAPFYRGQEGLETPNDRLPAFHSDNVIDPDLAAYLSDDGESEEEEQSIAGALAGTDKLRSDQASTTAPVAGLRRPRSRYGDNLKFLTGAQIDPDAMSISSSKAGTPRHLRRRNVSFTGSIFQNSPPKPQRLSVAAKQWSSPSLDRLDSASLQNSLRDSIYMTRSVSMQGPRAPPIELNNASLEHGKRLLRQMLQESKITETERWEKALMPILLRATDDVVPNVQAGDAINITNYVKLKKVPGGKTGDTSYISGVVFSKNVALKSMKRNILNPNILIITFALEYSRHEAHFMSLEPVIRQEREYLQNLVNRIAALRPELLLVQRNVSGLALEMLDKANIAVAYNVKRSVLEAISRCCQTRIVTSLDKLASQPDSHSSCESFYLKTFLFENRRKTYMYLSGCPKELGCTIVLRGANTGTLRRVKRVAEFMLQAIYNLRLETSLMRDEFALIPHYGAEGTIRYEAIPVPKNERLVKWDTGSDSRPATADTGGANFWVMAQAEKHAEGLSLEPLTQEDKPAAVSVINEKQSDLPDDIPAPTFYSDLVEKQRSRILSTSPFVKFMQPYLLMRARESERRLTHLKRLLDQDLYDLSQSNESRPGKFVLITPEMINETVHGTSRKIREIIHAVHESEYDKATHVYKTQAKQWETSVSGNADMFNPLSHQGITVLHSLVSTATNIACTGPDVFTIKFYDDRGADGGPEADCTLGQYVEDTCISAGEACHIHGCEKRMHEHHRHYVHGEGRLEVTIERLPPKAPGLHEIPLMWSACRICGKETQTVPMSENTWNYSFGKYLELAFWSIPLKPRAEICPHDIHHDHWRYFGYKNWAIRLQYDHINLLEVIVPRTRITWKVVNDLKFKNENFRKAEKRLNKFVTSVRARLKSIRLDTLLPENVDACKEEIERLTKLITEDQQKVLGKLQEKYEGSKFYEIVPFNRAMRMLHEKAGEWDDTFADFADTFLPSEKDIKRLATIQVKKLLFGTEDSSNSFASTDDTTNASFTDDPNDESSGEGTLASASQSQVLSPEKAHDVMTAVVEASARDAQNEIDEERSEKIMMDKQAGETQASSEVDSPVVDHLDLAVPSPTSPSAARQATSAEDASAAAIAEISQPEALKELPMATETVSEGAALTPVMSEDGQTEKRKPKLSGIPRFTEHFRRKSKNGAMSPGQRSQSQPAHLRQLSTGEPASPAGPNQAPESPRSPEDPQSPVSPEGAARPQKSFSQRLVGLRTGQSMIPRSIGNPRKDSKVSVLAKHFEQLISKEFQQERLRDKKKRAARQRQAGAYPAAALRPTVEVYNTLQEAVGEEQGQDRIIKSDETEAETDKTERSASTAEALATNPVGETGGDGYHPIGTKAVAEGRAPETVEEPIRPGTDNSNESQKFVSEPGSPSQPSVTDSILQSEGVDGVSAEEEIDDLELDLPRHEKTSIIKMLTNFWAERSASGWEALYYPLRDIDHVFANSDLIVREDEPSSLIALALDHGDYQAQLKSIEEASARTRVLSDKNYVEDLFLTVKEQAGIERSLLQDVGHHLSYQFERGPAKMQCKIFWAEQFEAVRKKCGVSERIVESLSRCLKWDSKGGKTKSVFLKTLDDRFVLKSLSPIETRSFLRFAPFYFNLMGEALFHELPSLIAKMLGFYQVTIRNPVTGTDFDWYLLLMENLFYDRTPDHTFDLKGSMRNRRIQPSGEQNEVLLDENMVDYIAENPIFAREHSKRLLRSSIYNDTLFLAKRNVMDYSLMLGIDEEKRELVVGIIDCIRTYTWDKKLESWVKDRGKNRPTVTEPKDYKNRFREAINRYVMETPNCWHFGLATNLGHKNARAELAIRDEDSGLADITFENES